MNAHDAWNTFWERQTRQAGGDTGQMPSSWHAIDAVQGVVWKEFGRHLPPKARVLDLATGDGRVMTHLLEKRRDLKLLGIDRAATLPSPPRGCKIRAATNMESLPLPDSQFAAVTSQFGFEYGDMPKIASEVSRVLRPDGRFAVMTHRIDGPIVTHNRKRREQLNWALETENLLTLARNSLALRNAGFAAIPPAIVAAPEKGAKLFGQNSAAWEIAEAILQTLHLGRHDTPANVTTLLDEIGAKAANELGRIESLELAATAASDHDAMLGALTDNGLELETARELVCDISPVAFADFRILRHIS